MTKSKKCPRIIQDIHILYILYDKLSKWIKYYGNTGLGCFFLKMNFPPYTLSMNEYLDWGNVTQGNLFKKGLNAVLT